MDAGRPTYNARLLWQKPNAGYDAPESRNAPEYDADDGKGYRFYSQKPRNSPQYDAKYAENDGTGYQPDESRDAGTNAGAYAENDGTGYCDAKPNASNDAGQ